MLDTIKLFGKLSSRYTLVAGKRQGLLGRMACSHHYSMLRDDIKSELLNL